MKRTHIEPTVKGSRRESVRCPRCHCITAVAEGAVLTGDHLYHCKRRNCRQGYFHKLDRQAVIVGTWLDSLPVGLTEEDSHNV